ncbi:MAG: hypothetical protein DMG40_14760 [Acidobacteria bacterium]|nr:MAG: hypothetical protein DMG40_14760 [Acidobacteriota bacterium]
MSQTPGAFSLETWWEKLIERTPVKYISLVLGAIGIWLVWEFPPGYFRYSIGEAAVIAALLMLLVDPFLKARLLKEAARDIFEYLLGFDQQPQLKERLKRLVFDTKLFRKNFNGRYKLVPQADFMQIEMEFDFELVNPTEEAIEFQYKIDFEQAENPRLDSVTLVSSEKNYAWRPTLQTKEDEPWVLQGFADPVEIQPASKGISYRFDGKCAVSYPLSFYYAQHFGYPTIGVTITIEYPETLEVDAAPTPSHEGNVWRYERLFMPGDHISIRWKQTK